MEEESKLLKPISKHFRSQVSELLSYPHIKFSISNLLSSCKVTKRNGDRFIVNQEYCGKNLSCQVILDHSNPTIPPDFINDFINYDDLIPLLNEWDTSNSKCLLDLMMSVRKKYKEVQLKNIESYPNKRMSFECSSLISLEGVEFFVKEDLSRASISLPLTEIDFSTAFGDNFLPKDVSVESLGHPTLLISFEEDEGEHPEVNIQIPPLWNKYSKQSHTLIQKIPNWTEEMIVVDFITKIKESWEEHHEVYLKRRNLIENLIEKMGTPIEYDNFLYKKVTFLTDYNQYVSLIYIQLPDYPDKGPRIVLQSCVHVKGRTPMTRTIVELPNYDNSWDVDEVSKRIKNFLKENLSPFIKACKENSSQGM